MSSEDQSQLEITNIVANVEPQPAMDPVEPQPATDLVEPQPAMDPEEAELLRKLDSMNRLIEEDKRSAQNILLLRSDNSPNSNESSNISRRDSMKSSNSDISNLANDEHANSEEEWALWKKVVINYPQYQKQKLVLADLVRKGIPSHFRPLAWQLLCDVKDNDALKTKYVEFLRRQSPCEKVIKRDVARTFPEHELFRSTQGQESLFNIMKAYSLYDREVGYCQGSGFISGVLLMTMPEEDAFCVFTKIMQDYKLREMCKPNMYFLGQCMYQLECLVEESLPELYNHFCQQAFHTSMYSSSWFLTLFATSFPLSLSLRVMDVFLLEGLDIIFRVALSLLETHQDELMMHDMEGMKTYFQKEMPAKHETDHDTLLGKAYSVKCNPKKMKKWEKDYNAMRKQEQEEQVEIRRLRTENRLLQQRIGNLEKENASLANRLVQDQVSNAQSAEEIDILKKKLSSQLKLCESLQKELREYQEQVKQLQNGGGTEESSSSSHVASISVAAAHSHVNGDRSPRTPPSPSNGDAGSELVDFLQAEVRELKRKDEGNLYEIHDLQYELKKLTEENHRLQRVPKLEIALMQEEMTTVKLREAEANLAMKEMRQRIVELQTMLEKHIERFSDPAALAAAAGASSTTSAKSEIQKLNEDLLLLRFREAEATGELKEMRQKVMELETKNQVVSNQIRRQDEEMQTLRRRIEEYERKETEQKKLVQSMRHERGAEEAKFKEDLMMSRIREAENAQSVAELRQKIAELEVQNQELLTAGKLQGDDRDLQEKLADLQEEVMQLRLQRGLPLPHQRIDISTDYEDTEDDADSDLLDELEMTLKHSSQFIVKNQEPIDYLEESRRLSTSDFDEEQQPDTVNSVDSVDTVNSVDTVDADDAVDTGDAGDAGDTASKECSV